MSVTLTFADGSIKELLAGSLRPQPIRYDAQVFRPPYGTVWLQAGSGRRLQESFNLVTEVTSPNDVIADADFRDLIEDLRKVVHLTSPAGEFVSRGLEAVSVTPYGTGYQLNAQFAAAGPRRDPDSVDLTRAGLLGELDMQTHLADGTVPDLSQNGSHAYSFLEPDQFGILLGGAEFNSVSTLVALDMREFSISMMLRVASTTEQGKPVAMMVSDAFQIGTVRTGHEITLSSRSPESGRIVYGLTSKLTSTSGTQTETVESVEEDLNHWAFLHINVRPNQISLTLDDYPAEVTSRTSPPDYTSSSLFGLGGGANMTAGAVVYLALYTRALSSLEISRNRSFMEAVLASRY